MNKRLCGILAMLSLVGLTGLLSGCPYGFSSSLLPGHIRTVAIPLPENRTDRGDLSSVLADSLVEAFIDNPVLKVADEKDADSLLEAVLLEYHRAPFTYDASENVLEYRVEVIAEVRFVDVRKNKVLWEEKRMRQWATYNHAEVGGQPAEEEDVGIARVVVRLRDDILTRTVEGW
ncbi:MAG: LptE family protein [Gemmatimonadota bacterium]|jgi:hypothetical protein|nr:LptE family protein [Gemmatimonadota bacterium]MDP6529422.1 LptE family protein [Gemmatimonadota bacterium]MDP6801899.1 LptE family protein [Gemmatimonadota bacterium]MDP7031625.1 LptE family protein [Gemmatimonadota bacterium]